MNTIKTIENARKVGGDYFRLIYVRVSDKYLKDFLHLFNFEDYWCFKCTNKQRLINYEDFLEFKYGGYIFFKKDLYDIDRIMEWLEWIELNLKKSRTGGIQFLNKPTPPFPPTKIIIKQQNGEGSK